MSHSSSKDQGMFSKTETTRKLGKTSPIGDRHGHVRKVSFEITTGVILRCAIRELGPDKCSFSSRMEQVPLSEKHKNVIKLKLSSEKIPSISRWNPSKISQ